MLSGFSHHHDNPSSGDGPARPDDYRALSWYMDGPWVMKSVSGARLRVDRGPVPEILYGRANQLRCEIAALPFQRKYRFGLMSFDAADIDVDAFNAGQGSPSRPATRPTVSPKANLEQNPEPEKAKPTDEPATWGSLASGLCSP